MTKEEKVSKINEIDVQIDELQKEEHRLRGTEIATGNYVHEQKAGKLENSVERSRQLNLEIAELESSK